MSSKLTWSEHLMAMDDMNDSGLGAKGTKCYEHLWAVDDMNDSGS